MNSFSQVPITTVEKYWDNHPCNINHSDKSLGAREYFEEVEKKRYFVEPHILTFADFEKYRGKKVLEIGCGIGTDSIMFAKNGADLTVVELSVKSLELCKKRFEVYGLNANFYLCNSENLSQVVPMEAYDLVYSFGVIHHTPHPERVIAEINKYLKPEGELKIMLYSKFSYKLFWTMKITNQWSFADIDNIITKHSEAQANCPISFTYTFEDVHKLLDPYFTVVEMYKDHIFPYEIKKYKRHEYEYDECFKGIDEDTFRQMKRELGWHILITATKN